MHKITKIILLYIAVLATGLFIMGVFESRYVHEQARKTESQIMTLNQELQKTVSSQSAAKITKQLARLETEISEISQKKDQKVLGSKQEVVTNTAVQTGFVKLLKEWQTADIYESNSYSASISGQLEPDQNYLYTKKIGNWYQIMLPSSNNDGWVTKRFVEEINLNTSE